MKHPFILTTICLLCGLKLSAQNYFITAAQDSVTCSQINFFNTNAQGKMIQLEYVDAANKTILLKNQDIPDIIRLVQDGVMYIKMPMKLAKPDGYYRYGKRVVSGQINVDELALKVKRAAELIKICKVKLHDTESDVQKILKDLDATSAED